MAHLITPVNEQDHVRGPYDAPVTLVEYGDFQCEHCAAMYPVLMDLLDEVGEQVRFVYRHFPLSQSHPNAQQAAEASEAAASQGSFWEMHDMLFTNQDALDEMSLRNYAEKIGLDADQYDREMESEMHAEKVREDFMSGVHSGVNGTPTFFINGERYDGRMDKAGLKKAISRAAQRV
jgi:formate-nitrite transporter family protein